MMDINVLSLSGFTNSDVEKLSDIEEIKEVELVNSIDTLATIQDKDYVFKAITYQDTINKIKLTEGSLPNRANECVLDSLIKNVLKTSFVFEKESKKENGFQTGSCTGSWIWTW